MTRAIASAVGPMLTPAVTLRGQAFQAFSPTTLSHFPFGASS